MNPGTIPLNLPLIETTGLVHTLFLDTKKDFSMTPALLNYQQF